jgi:hypothetical protein
MKSSSSIRNGKFCLPSVGPSSKNGSDVHPLFENTRPISKLPHNTRKSRKNKKIGIKGGGKGSSPQSVRLRAMAGRQPVVAR